MSRSVVLASGNRGKLGELQALLAATDLELLPQSDFEVADADETGLSFVENAILKARHAARATGLPAIADDSGLCVDALGGQPGIYSARFSGEGATDERNNALLLERLAGVSERGARFVCVLAYLRHATDPQPILCEGVWRGEILQTPRGENGFGYDPLFYVPALDRSSAELPGEQKNQVSHRGQALQQLIERLRAAGVTS